MKKRILIIFLIITMPLFSLMAVDSLSDYDITFYKTVSESLSIVNKEKFGFDYTGFGFIGQSKNGVFMRFGIQTPYVSIASLIKPIETQHHKCTESQYAESEDIHRYAALFQ